MIAAREKSIWHSLTVDLLAYCMVLPLPIINSGLDPGKNQDFTVYGLKNDFFILTPVAFDCSVIQRNLLPKGLLLSLGITSRNCDL